MLKDIQTSVGDPHCFSGGSGSFEISNQKFNLHEQILINKQNWRK